ncbi:MAG: L,D-transpeptidase [Pyrinomonadaceae bacterium MAG19_C2-C3]|nr:L,D-transpeptidase [Pyrinomonadaceae bacterium MAG19_C2-C3]
MHKNSLIQKFIFVAAFVMASSTAIYSQTETPGSIRFAERNESARSDKYTGGTVERATLQPSQPDIKITVDVPAFRLTLWQNGREVKTYSVGIGLKDYPIFVGELRASEVIWNPDWIPPDSDWVGERKGVRPGQIIPASSPANPLGKLKIPLGHGYLIHEANGAGNLGNLVSHGCLRMVRADLYDLAEKIVFARDADVSGKDIANAKRTFNTVVAKLDAPLPVDINYDTQIVEGGKLYVYSDVYERKTSTLASLRRELELYGVNPLAINEDTHAEILKRVTRGQGFVVSLNSIAAGRALADGRMFAVVPQRTKAKPKARSTRRT